MGLDLKVFLSNKEDIESGFHSVSAVSMLKLVRRSDLFSKIDEIPSKELPFPLLIGGDEMVEEDKYGNKLRYVECSELSKVISAYEEQFRGHFNVFRNDAFASLLESLDDQCYAVLYWH